MKTLLQSAVMACIILLAKSIAWSQTQQSYSGSPVVVPGTIEAENFDIGGQSVSYYDVTVANSGGQYRTNESVDIENCSEGGYNIYRIDTYEWLEYTINISESSGYSFEFKVASTNSAGKIDVTLDGASIGAVKIPNTGGMQTWRTVKLSYGGFGYQLTAGTHVLRLSFSNTETHYNMFNLDKIIVSKEYQYAITRNEIPGIVEAENYDLSFGNGEQAYYDLTSGNAGGVNRSVGRIPLSEDVDIENCSEGGRNIGWIQSGEWLEYTIHVMQEDIYTISARVASNTSLGSFQLELNGNAITNALTVPYTGGWQNWQTVSQAGIPLQAGTHILRVKMTGSEFNINKFEFSKSVVSAGCTGIYNTDYSFEVSNDLINPTITFNPITSGVGSNLVILYYGTGSGTYPGYFVTPGVPYQINATSGQAVNFYFTYSHPAGGERSSIATPHTVTIGSCGSSSSRISNSSSLETSEGLSLYPNPMKESNLLYFTKSDKVVSVKIMNANGSNVLQVNNWNTSSPLDLNTFINGIYYVVITDDNTIETIKIVR